MKLNFLLNIKSAALLAVIVGLLLSFVSFTLTPKAYAATDTEEILQLKVQELLKLIEQATNLQLRLNEANPDYEFIPGRFCQYKWTDNLALGSEGEAVKNLQKLLTKTGDYEAEISGVFDTVTERAVQRFQEKKGIVSRGTSETTGFGFVGKLTRNALNTLHSCNDIKEFGFSDVKSVTSSYIDPATPIDGDEYYKFTVTLKNDKKHVIKYYPSSEESVLQQLFLDEGYTGNVDKLFALAGVLPDSVIKRFCEYEWTQPLGLGSEGAAVTKLQNFLRKQGDYNVEITGYYGPKTEKAVQRFQEKKEIVLRGTPETTGYGVVGLLTLNAINKANKCADDKKTITDSTSASVATGVVDLKVKGSDSLNQIKAERYLDISWSTQDVKNCELVKEYKGKTITSDVADNHAGRSVLLVRAKSTYGLDSIMLRCKDIETGKTIKDKIQIEFFDTLHKYVATVGSKEVSNTKTSRETALGRCISLVRENSGKNVQCTFDGEDLFGSTNKTDEQEDESGNVLGVSTVSMNSQLSSIISGLHSVVDALK
jgi:peptidoglycan hydrolase-like protein with peptidoglycan-binding domain